MDIIGLCFYGAKKMELPVPHSQGYMQSSEAEEEPMVSDTENAQVFVRTRNVSDFMSRLWGEGI
jgi:hypothetical protein